MQKKGGCDPGVRGDDVLVQARTTRVVRGVAQRDVEDAELAGVPAGRASEKSGRGERILINQRIKI